MRDTIAIVSEIIAFVLMAVIFFSDRNVRRSGSKVYRALRWMMIIEILLLVLGVFRFRINDWDVNSDVMPTLDLLLKLILSGIPPIFAMGMIYQVVKRLHSGFLGDYGSDKGQYRGERICLVIEILLTVGLYIPFSIISESAEWGVKHALAALGLLFIRWLNELIYGIICIVHAKKVSKYIKEEQGRAYFLNPVLLILPVMVGYLVYVLWSFDILSLGIALSLLFADISMRARNELVDSETGFYRVNKLDKFEKYYNLSHHRHGCALVIKTDSGIEEVAGIIMEFQPEKSIVLESGTGSYIMLLNVADKNGMDFMAGMIRDTAAEMVPEAHVDVNAYYLDQQESDSTFFDRIRSEINGR